MSEQRMSLAAALEVLAKLRRDEIVVTTMGAAREWPKHSQSPLDFHYLPSAMGHAPAFALGLALAQPEREVIAFNGDGCMLMGLSVLATIAASTAKNLTVIVLDNGIYEVTGGQRTVGGAIGVDYAQVAKASGIATVHHFSDLAQWQASAAAILREPGPRFISLKVQPVGESFHLPPPEPVKEKHARFQKAIGVSA